MDRTIVLETLRKQYGRICELVGMPNGVTSPAALLDLLEEGAPVPIGLVDKYIPIRPMSANQLTGPHPLPDGWIGFHMYFTDSELVEFALHAETGILAWSYPIQGCIRALIFDLRNAIYAIRAKGYDVKIIEGSWPTIDTVMCNMEFYFGDQRAI